MKPGKIVVGTDGSASAMTAVRWAACAAERADEPLQIVVAYHVQVPGRWYGSLHDLAAAADERAGGIASEAAAVARSTAPHAEVACSLMVGDPAPVLLDAADGASVLVVGSRGPGGFGGLLLGSVGMHVAMHARCPVTVVRGNSEKMSGPVIVGVAPRRAADDPIGLAFEQAAERHCPLRAITTYAVPLPPSPIGIPPLLYEAGRAADELRTELGQRLAVWHAKYPDVAVDYEVVQGNPAEVLVARSRDAQLVVVGTHAHASLTGVLLGSVAMRLLHHAECPVLIARGR